LTEGLLFFLLNFELLVKKLDNYGFFSYI
jgi:hypothetical protein